MSTNKAQLIEQVRANVPEQLRLLRVWLLHGPDKTPIYANGENRSGEMDTPEDRQKFVTFETAADALTRVERASGLGVALGEVPGEELRLCGIDLDDCYDAGDLNDRVMQILGAANSYTEKSPSGAGLHILGIGDIGTHKSDRLEIYSGGRYFTVTGVRINGAHLTDIAEAAAFAKKLLLDPPPQPADHGKSHQSHNDVVAALKRVGLYLRAGTGGKHLTRCPWEIRHTPNEAGSRQTSSTEAAYFEPGAVVRDEQLKCGMFKCMHAHCADRGLKQLREFLGLDRGNDQGEETVLRTPLDWRVFESQTPPDRQWAIDHWLGMGHVTLLAGAGGTGKTLVAQAVGSCLALRREYLDWIPHARCVLAWFCEDDEMELWRRQVTIARWLGVRLSEFAGKFTAYSYDGQQVELAGLIDQRLVVAPMMLQLREQIGDLKADVVLLDNLARLYAGNENDRHQVTSFVAMLTAAAAPTRAAVLLLGHPGKARGSEYSGSTAWEGAVRSRLYLGRMMPDADKAEQEEAATEDDGVRYLCRRKANYSVRDTRRLQFRDGILIPDAPLELPHGSLPGPEYARDVITRAVRKLAEMGEHGVASSSSPKYLPKLASDYKLLDRLTKRDFAVAMRGMQSDKKLTLAVVGKYANRTAREALVLTETT